MRSYLLSHVMNLLVIALLGGPADCDAKKAATWVGKSFMLKARMPQTAFSDSGGKPLKDVALTESINVVLKQEGKRICVLNRGKEVWLDTDSAILLDDACRSSKRPRGKRRAIGSSCTSKVSLAATRQDERSWLRG
jgi:hypothetical protein